MTKAERKQLRRAIARLSELIARVERAHKATGKSKQVFKKGAG